ncbi:enteropeptidase-like [Branchiostoma floridae x Branchiostoma japonicum]
MHQFEFYQGWYIYIETSSPRRTNDRAVLLSADIPANQTKCLQFWYHMYGYGVGTLNIKLYANETFSQPIWTRRGTQQNAWRLAHVPVDGLTTSIRIALEALKGSGFRCDIAVDDVTVTDETCPSHVTPTPGCGGNLTAPSGGPVTSPNYPSNYGNQLNCEWSITLPEGRIIRLKFDYFNTDNGYDILTIYDGANDSATQLQRLTSSLRVSPITSTSNMMFLRFTSDSSITRRGFSFTYTSIVAGHCWDPGVPTNGYRDNNSNFTPGETVRYSCMAGYQLWGTENITCRSNGTWSDAIPTCEVGMSEL